MTQLEEKYTCLGYEKTGSGHLHKSQRMFPVVVLKCNIENALLLKFAVAILISRGVMRLWKKGNYLQNILYFN